ncbi:MAG TPA: glucose-6-phosphate dehydrogenase, partial [Caldimonas sp.]
LWRRECIANIQITLAESIGVGTRGDFYSRTGALRDMVQNHALQLLTMVAMEPPSRMVADAIRDEKLKVLRSLKPFSIDSVGRDVVRGQYRSGSVGGKAVPAYADEDKVPAGSTTETFVALRTEVQNWRWAGVPFYLRTGKRLAARDAQIVVNFRRTPHLLFPGLNAPNRLIIKLQPEDGLELHLLAAKGAFQGETLAPVSLDLDFDKAFAENRVGAYERLLLDVIAGRLNLFVRSDEQEEAWAWVEPILDAWQCDDAGPRPYAAGSWGPAAASALVARDGNAWAEEA